MLPSSGAGEGLPRGDLCCGTFAAAPSPCTFASRPALKASLGPDFLWESVANFLDVRGTGRLASTCWGFRDIMAPSNTARRPQDACRALVFNNRARNAIFREFILARSAVEVAEFVLRHACWSVFLTGLVLEDLRTRNLVEYHVPMIPLVCIPLPTLGIAWLCDWALGFQELLYARCRVHANLSLDESPSDTESWQQLQQTMSIYPIHSAPACMMWVEFMRRFDGCRVPLLRPVWRGCMRPSRFAALAALAMSLLWILSFMLLPSGILSYNLDAPLTFWESLTIARPEARARMLPLQLQRPPSLPDSLVGLRSSLWWSSTLTLCGVAAVPSPSLQWL